MAISIALALDFRITGGNQDFAAARAKDIILRVEHCEIQADILFTMRAYDLKEAIIFFVIVIFAIATAITIIVIILVVFVYVEELIENIMELFNISSRISS